MEDLPSKDTRDSIGNKNFLFSLFMKLLVFSFLRSFCHCLKHFSYAHFIISIIFLNTQPYFYPFVFLPCFLFSLPKKLRNTQFILDTWIWTHMSQNEVSFTVSGFYSIWTLTFTCRSYISTKGDNLDINFTI